VPFPADGFWSEKSLTLFDLLSIIKNKIKIRKGNFMEKKEAQRFWGKAEKQLKRLSSKAVEIAKGLQREAVYGVKFTRLKIDEMGLESKRVKLFQEIGSETFKLVKKNKLKNSKISKLCALVDRINKEIGKKKVDSSLLKKKLLEGIKKLK
jgi:hypothetical protein